MATARAKIINDSHATTYHCVSRCVRRAYLCGIDKVTGRDYSHRRQWVQDRLQKLKSIFLIKVLEFGLLSNHHHLMLRTNPEALREASDREILERWLMLYPQRFEDDEEKRIYFALQLADPQRLAVLRERLGNISWFMKSLSEYIARRANKEDGCTGRFWEGRFKAQVVEGEAATLACSVYINLNPVRAKIAQTPEESQFTSVYLRIRGKARWLEEHDDYLPQISWTDYLEVLDSSGRCLKPGKRGAITERLSPILQRLGINDNPAKKGYFKGFTAVIGKEASLKAYATTNSCSWIKGMSAARQVFS